MLTSITPLGERGRGQRWPITMAWLFVGHVVGGLALGGLLAATGEALRLVADPSTDAAVAVLAVLVVLAAVIDLSGRPLPGRRQVDEAWLGRYRGWVYGVGFGVQLGFGLVTVVNTALVVPMLVAGVVVPAPAALGVGALYGGLRGIGALAGAGVRSVGALRALHRGLDRSEALVRIGGAGVAAALSVGLALAV